MFDVSLLIAVYEIFAGSLLHSVFCTRLYDTVLIIVLFCVCVACLDCVCEIELYIILDHIKMLVSSHSDDDKIYRGNLMNEKDLDGNNKDDLINGTKHHNSKMDLAFDLSDSVINDTTSANDMTRDGNDSKTKNENCNGSLKHTHAKSEKTMKKKKSGETRCKTCKNNNTKIDLAPVRRNIGKKLEEFKSKTVNDVHKLKNMDSINNNENNNSSNTGSFSRQTQHHGSSITQNINRNSTTILSSQESLHNFNASTLNLPGNGSVGNSNGGFSFVENNSNIYGYNLDSKCWCNYSQRNSTIEIRNSKPK